MLSLGQRQAAFAAYLCMLVPAAIADGSARSPADARAASAQSMPSALAREKNCPACHEVDKKVVGPAFADIARRYHDDPGAVQRLSKKVTQGGQGAWGQVPMPPHPALTPADVEKLVKWVLSL